MDVEHFRGAHRRPARHRGAAHGRLRRVRRPGWSASGSPSRSTRPVFRLLGRPAGLAQVPAACRSPLRRVREGISLIVGARSARRARGARHRPRPVRRPSTRRDAPAALPPADRPTPRDLRTTNERSQAPGRQGGRHARPGLDHLRPRPSEARPGAGFETGARRGGARCYRGPVAARTRPGAGPLERPGAWSWGAAVLAVLVNVAWAPAPPRRPTLATHRGQRHRHGGEPAVVAPAAVFAKAARPARATSPASRRGLAAPEPLGSRLPPPALVVTFRLRGGAGRRPERADAGLTVPLPGRQRPGGRPRCCFLGSGGRGATTGSGSLLDGGLVACTLLLLSWYTALGHVSPGRERRLARASPSHLAYPIGDVVTTVVVILHGGPRAPDGPRACWSSPPRDAAVRAQRQARYVYLGYARAPASSTALYPPPTRQRVLRRRQP